MTKSINRKNPKHGAKPEKAASKEAAYLFLPWTCKHYPDRSEIEAYLPGRDWETIVEMPANPGIDAELVAEFIARTVNGYEKVRDLVFQMAEAIELCLTCGDSLTWEAEQGAEASLNKAKRDFGYESKTTGIETQDTCNKLPKPQRKS